MDEPKGKKELFFKRMVDMPPYFTEVFGNMPKPTRWQRILGTVRWRSWLVRRRIALWICPSLSDE